MATPHSAHDGHDHEGHDHADHAHDDGHDHGAPGHDHGSELRAMAVSNRNRLIAVIGVGLTITIAEVAIGFLANSLALLSDAAHAATDTGALALALLAVTWSVKAASRSKTFGYRRAEVVSAFVNALALWVISAYFIYEAWHRLMDPPAVRGFLVMVMGGITLVANAGMAFALHRGAAHSLNMRAAYAHVLSDLLGSAVALLAGYLVYSRGWLWADPLLTLVISVLILRVAWKLTRDTLHVLMQGTPKHLDLGAIESSMGQIPGVASVHDIHAWTLTDGHDFLTAHIVTNRPDESGLTVLAVHEHLLRAYKLRHVTIQVEAADAPCPAPCVIQAGAA